MYHLYQLFGDFWDWQREIFFWRKKIKIYIACMSFISLNFYDTRRVLVGYPPRVTGNGGGIFMLGKALSRHTKETNAGFYKINE
jgi:hypothetical protein